MKATRLSDGLVFSGNDGEQFKITQLSIDRKMTPAHTFGLAIEKPAQHSDNLVLTDDQKELANRVRVFKRLGKANRIRKFGPLFWQKMPHQSTMVPISLSVVQGLWM